MTSPRFTWTLIAVALHSLLGVGGASAQRAPAELDAITQANPAVAIGSRIRITDATDGSQIIGTLTDLSSVAVTLELDGGALRRTPVERIASTEVHGRDTDFISNFMKVELVATVTTSLLAGLTYRDQECSFICIGPQSRGEAFVWGAAGGALLSLPIAVIVGAVKEEDTWTPATISTDRPAIRDRVRVRVAPSSGGVTLSGSIALGGGG